MNAEMSGGLIQMTAHMEVTAGALRLMIAGGIVAMLSALLAICVMVSRQRDDRVRYVLAFAVFALLGVGMMIAGANAPREKILMCCADGPVSLEQVAARYDIRRVDGKLLVLAER